MASLMLLSPRTERHEGNSGMKTATFYKNGDRYFKGHVMAITPRRFRSMDMLLSELSRVTDLPRGVRYLLSLDNGAKIEALDQIHDGKAYVCSSNSRLKKIQYGNSRSLPHWGSGNRLELPKLASGSLHSESKTKISLGRQRADTNDRNPANVGPRTVVAKPKIVTVIRNGHSRPRVTVKVLLNKRTAQNLDQVLNAASDAIGAAGGRSVRKLFASNGQQITAVNELFLDGSGIFIAVGSETFRPEDATGIVEDFSQGSQQKQKKHSVISGNGGMHKQRDRNDSQKEASSNEKENKGEPKENGGGTNLAKEVNNNVRVSKLPDIHERGGHSSRLHEVQKAHISHKPASKRQQGKQIQRDNKQKDKSLGNKYGTRSGSVKLPQIGNSTLVTKSDKAGKHERAKPGHQGDNSPSTFGRSSEVENVNKVEPEAAATAKKANGKGTLNKKPSEDTKTLVNKAHEETEEVEYGTVRDKNVEDVYYIGKKIGDGNFAVVRQCTHKINKKEFALKIIDRSKIRGKEKMIRDETAIMRKCRHENIVRLFEDFDAPTEIYLVMELIKGGDLFDAISSAVKFSERVAKGYVTDVCKALDYLHKQRIVHRDLKPENLLVHETPRGQVILKLADFGLAMEVTSPIFTVCGTPTYVAPEILEESGYGLKVDMWAAGVITYIMLCGFPPFRSARRDQDELFDLIQEGRFEFLSPYWDPISSQAKNLISHLLVVEVKSRYSAEQVLQHPWIRQRSATADELKKQFLSENKVAQSKAKKRFKAAALAVQGAKKFENLAEQFRRQRGEKVILT